MSAATSAHHTTSTSTAGGDALLRLALRLDAVATGALGLGLAVGGGLVDSLLGIPAAALHGVGAFFVVYAIALGALSTRRTINRNAARAVVAVNAVWVLDSVVVLGAGLWSFTAIGTAAFVAVAAAVAGFAAVQFLGLRRMA
ncbi:MAG: hypothetical protein ACRDXX_19810 [Stackebrandtia sp.]